MKFLVIGLGSIGTRHAKNLKALGHEVYGFDTDESRYEATGIKKEPHELTKFDAHIICSPTTEHARHLWNATTDHTHAFVEKPLACKVSEVSSYPEIVAVGNNLRFNHCIQFAKNKMLLIGQPQWAYFCVAQSNTKYKDHVLLSWGAHEIDLALHFLGPAQVATARGDDKICDVMLLHDSGVRTTVHVDYLSVPHRRLFTIHGTEGYIDCDIERQICLVMGTNNLVKGHFQDETNAWPDQSYRDEMIAFVNALQGTTPIARRWPGATAEDGLATLKIIEAAQACLQS